MIGRTLFWYIFRDLMKYFLMANGALAGIMSFGGLLRPLTHQGLDVGQIGKLLACFNMAMLTYSMPIAALFATTVVYGRLSADNELTACRAGGLSHLTIAFPAFVMGVLVAALSMVFLCFIVPIYTMKAEQVLYSNMAKLVASNIQRNHKIEFGTINIFAQEAYIPPESSTEGGEQMVVLKGPTFETFERPYKDQRDYHVPKDFYTASEAVIYIESREKGEQRGTGKVYVTAHLEDGFKFPRTFVGAMQAGIGSIDYGPMAIDSPMKEEPKFMDVWKLKRLYKEPVLGSRVRRAVDDLVQRDQQRKFSLSIWSKLDTKHSVRFDFGDDETYILTRDPNSPSPINIENVMILPAELPVAQLGTWVASQAASDAAMTALGAPPLAALPMGVASEWRPVTFQRIIKGQSPPIVTAAEAHLQVHVGSDPNQMHVSLELIDAKWKTGGDLVERKNFPVQTFDVPTPQDVQEVGKFGVQHYLLSNDPIDKRLIGRTLLVLSNQILAESHSRVSFALSCLVLVMVGCALGLMFRSGNFLSAFAVSFIPALITITLIVAGQRISGNIPDMPDMDFATYANSPLQVGLCLIWAGNCLNFVLAALLLGRLQKQ